MNALILLPVLYAIVCGDNLYDKLHVSSSATATEIRTAYKREVMLWHPDKNPSKIAQEKFIEITNAYEVLSNPRKRAKYDAYGVYDIGDDNISNNPPSRAEGDFFSHLFGGHFHPFSRFTRDENVAIVTFQTYREKLLPASRTAPLMLLCISHFCFICQQIQPLWSKIAGQYSNMGVIFGITNIQDDQALREELNVLHSPSVITVIDGKTSYFMQSEFTEVTLVDFLVQALLDIGPLRSAPLRGLPSTTLATPLLTPVKSEAEFDNFLSGWLKDSRPRALFVKAASRPPLHFCVAAFRAVDFYASGFFGIEGSSSKPILQRLNLSQSKESIVVFHESPHEAVAYHSAEQLLRRTIDITLIQNSRLAVPRLLNSAHFLDLCPANGRPPSTAFASASETAPTESAHDDHTGHRHLCLVLLLQYKRNNDLVQLNLLRSVLNPFIPRTLDTLSPTNSLPKGFLPILSPVYIFTDRQAAWINNVTASSTCPSCLGSLPDLDGRLLALWRISSRILAFRLLPQNLSLQFVELNSVEVFAERLKMSVASLLMNMTVVEDFLTSHDARTVKSDVAGWSLSYLSRMEALFVDELAAPLWLRIRLKLWSLCRAVISYFDNMWVDPVDFFLTSGFTFVLVTILIIYRMGWNFGLETSSRSSSPSSNSDLKKQFTPPDIPYSRIVDDSRPRSLLLTPSTYHRLVLASPKGQFSIFLCTDASPLGQRLADQFYHICHRYGDSSNATLIPACLFLDRYADWLGWALEAATRIPFRSSSSFRTSDHVALTFNPDNCRGTVLAVNGFRRYFHIYHPLLPSAQVGSYGKDSEYGMEEEEINFRRRHKGRNLSKESRRVANFSKILGLNRSSDDESDYESEEEDFEGASAPTTQLLEHEVLAGLSMWFDRLFEGSLRRYHVSEWPQHLTLSS